MSDDTKHHLIPRPRRVPTLYLSGPMTGLPDYNRPAFEAAKVMLTDAGYAVLSPTDAVCEIDEPGWADWMRVDLAMMLRCDAVATLAGIEKSRGGQVECNLAASLGMPVAPVEWWTSHRVGGDDRG